MYGQQRNDHDFLMTFLLWEARIGDQSNYRESVNLKDVTLWIKYNHYDKYQITK